MKQREYPREIIVGDSLWRVRFIRRIPADLEMDSNDTGACCPADHTIYIKMGQTPVERFKTFVHELIHAAEYEWQIDMPHKIVEDLEEPIYRILLDNGIIRF